MDKKSFISILNNYSGSSVAEALDILLLKQKYPYSQILHVLAAKVSKEHGFSTQQQELQLAAVYSSDRAVLKEVMAKELLNHDTISTPVNFPLASVVIPKTEEIATPLLINVNADLVGLVKADLDGVVDLANEVVNDLIKLQQSRSNFESLFISKEKSESESEVRLQGSLDGQEEIAAKSKKERIIEIAKALEATGALIAKPFKRKRENTEAIIEQIANTKKKLDPENDAQKAQIEVIEQFIKAQPNIPNSKDKPLPPPGIDLSVIKPGEFGDNIISETLVDILLKQGKKEKAIEVLKKLIWKFPQKKAYFVAQIEELKK